MTKKTKSVSFGRARLPHSLAHKLEALQPGLRSRAIAIILNSHSTGLDLGKLIEASTELKRLRALINQSLRLSVGTSVDAAALRRAVEIVNSLGL